MIKILLIIMIIIINVHAEYMPKHLTAEESQKVNDIDKKLYELASNTKRYDLDLIARFIANNLAYKINYNKFTIVGTASARTVENLTKNNYTNESDRVQAQIKLKYPFYDAKEKNEKLKKMMLSRQKIINEVKKHFKIKLNHNDLETEKLIIERIEIRAKARKIQGIGSFDDWLQVIKDLKKVNYDLALSNIELSENILLLLNYVKKNKQNTLKEML